MYFVVYIVGLILSFSALIAHKRKHESRYADMEDSSFLCAAIAWPILLPSLICFSCGEVIFRTIDILFRIVESKNDSGK